MPRINRIPPGRERGQKRKFKSARGAISRQRGSVLVELAICLPLLTTIVLMAIEATAVTFARQAMVQTAYEAAVIAIRREATNLDAIAAARNVTNGRMLDQVSIRFEPSDVSQVPRGGLVTVFASVPASAAKRIESNLLPFGIVSASATMVKE